MRIVTLAGSPRFPPRSSALLEYARDKLSARDVEVCHWHLQNFAPEDLLYARFDSPALLTLIDQLSEADGLIVATPVYKASFSGALKTLLDLLPERALEHKVVLPLATGGTIAHLLAVDYALKPVLNAQGSGDPARRVRRRQPDRRLSPPTGVHPRIAAPPRPRAGNLLAGAAPPAARYPSPDTARSRSCLMPFPPASPGSRLAGC